MSSEATDPDAAQLRWEPAAPELIAAMWTAMTDREHYKSKVKPMGP